MMVDLTRDEHGCLQARLLDAVQGRSGKVYADWLTEHGVDAKVTVEHAALDPFRGYANAIRDELPDAVAVLDAFRRQARRSTASSRRPGGWPTASATSPPTAHAPTDADHRSRPNHADLGRATNGSRTLWFHDQH